MSAEGKAVKVSLETHAKLRELSVQSQRSMSNILNLLVARAKVTDFIGEPFEVEDHDNDNGNH